MEIWRVGDGPWGWCSYSTMLALLLCPPVLLSLASLLPHCYKTAAVFQSNTSSFKMRNRRSRKVYLHGCLSLFFRRGAEGGTHRLRPITPQAPLGRACFAGDQAIVLPKHKSRLCSRSQGASCWPGSSASRRCFRERKRLRTSGH